MKPIVAPITAFVFALAGGCATDSEEGGGGTTVAGESSGESTSGVPDASSSSAAGSSDTSAGSTSETPTTGIDETSSSSGSDETSTTGDCVPHTPWLYAGFDDASPGDSLGGGPFNTAGRTVAADAQAFHGSISAQMEIREGDAGGFGQWGGIVNLPDVPEGESVWVRLWAYWPSDFEFSASPWMKFLRLHDRRADGSNGGYNDLYIDNADGPDSVLRIIKELHNVWEVYDGDPIPRDQWERYEMQIVVDDTSVDDGGMGRFRVWRDDTLIFDRTDVPTVSGPGGVLDGLYIFTYWNNEMPPNNTMFIDELAITFGDNPPPQVDDNGLPYFGDWLPCK